MRKIDKQSIACPQALLDCQQAHEALVLDEKNTHKFESECYRNACKEVLFELYHRKCAFCEQQIPENKLHTLTIEHFRPKSKDSKYSSEEHAYYWLGYEWTNLLPSCEACNGKKRSKFKITNTRVALPPLDAAGRLDLARCKADSPELLAEGAHLIHPEIEDPKEFLRFSTDNNLGNFEMNFSQKGNYSIETCNLNRPELKSARHKEYTNVQKEFLNKIEYARQTKGNILANLNLILGSILYDLCRKGENSAQEFSAFYAFLFEDFEAVFGPYFQKEFGNFAWKTIAQAYHNFRTTHSL